MSGGVGGGKCLLGEFDEWKDRGDLERPVHAKPYTPARDLYIKRRFLLF